ncbi:DnaJ domain-containing protein [Fusobacterium periodonticum]|uniref:J domain-containing protein n=1 Tax=Fusobacterium periodonticum TaxID=860 RepID=UPI0028D4D560|nr:DnaJ domain-containing protein [Fusobacterium periodonticum]
MEAVLLPLVVMFFILVMTLGVDKASKAILPLTIITILVYFFGWDIFKYAFIFVLFILFLIFFFIFKLLKKAASSSNTYRRTRTQNDDFFGGYRNNTRSNNNSNGKKENNTYSDTRYYGSFSSQEEAEEFFRNIFGSSFGTNSNNGTYSNTRTNGTFTQEEAEEFFRDFFGGSFGGQGSTYGNSSGGYRQGGNYQRTGAYTSNKSKYYRILGLKDGASQEEIKKAYRQLAKEHHPDKFVNASDSEKKYHESKMKEINEAYENLKI